MPNKHIGGCHCGNISYEMQIPNEPASYNPRACDCDFCTKHGASYISDTNGTLSIFIKNKEDLIKYKQGSGLADFLLCKNCGVLVGVCYETNGHIYGSVNSKTVKCEAEFGEDLVVSPKHLNDNKRIKRWQSIWFDNVLIEYESTLQGGQHRSCPTEVRGKSKS